MTDTKEITVKFTPGPWSVDGVSSHHQPARRVISGDSCIATVWQSPSWSKAKIECADNAALIAAAPDLFEALRDLLEGERYHTMVGGNPIAVEKLLNRAAAALAKARGKP